MKRIYVIGFAVVVMMTQACAVRTYVNNTPNGKAVSSLDPRAYQEALQPSPLELACAKKVEEGTYHYVTSPNGMRCEPNTPGNGAAFGMQGEPMIGGFDNFGSRDIFVHVFNDLNESMGEIPVKAGRYAEFPRPLVEGHYHAELRYRGSNAVGKTEFNVDQQKGDARTSSGITVDWVKPIR